jgi:integrase
MTDHTAPAQPAAVTVAEVVERFLQHSDRTGRHAPRSRVNVEGVLREFALACGPLPVAEAKGYHLTDFVEGRPTWKSQGMRSTAAKIVNACFNWAVLCGRTDKNPFAAVHYSEGERRAEMTDDTLKLYLRAANKPFERVLRFLRYTGCRIGELCAARWEDLDLEKGVWLVHRHKTRRQTGRPKVKALTAEAVKLLRDIGPGAGHVFLNTRGQPFNYSACEEYFRHLRRDVLKLPASTGSIHSIRHRFASAAVAAGAPLRLVAEQLGHSTMRTTERHYLHLANSVDAIREAVSRGAPAPEPSEAAASPEPWAIPFAAVVPAATGTAGTRSVSGWARRRRR